MQHFPLPSTPPQYFASDMFDLQLGLETSKLLRFPATLFTLQSIIIASTTILSSDHAKISDHLCASVLFEELGYGSEGASAFLISVYAITLC